MDEECEGAFSSTTKQDLDEKKDSESCSKDVLDPTRKYFKDIGRIPILTAKEEYALAMKVKGGDEKAR